ncbi:hypothetical protein ACFSE0_20765 [Ochrobactrum teleogrylli]|uniref:Uncharacterized protein n=1 Tax=Ochrobactrum teleogrylli TaxID=2479765 RepID=A0ABY2Y3D9_9HYPH|nr:hypothetical protein [[Ochrobactrum] teleogrylli]TNV13863.1 hypothetical protein FIC94_14760 [[Ochrobactrum] teleogrylli]
MAYIPLQLNITQGSGPDDAKHTGIKPSNIATVYGSPGAALTARITGDAGIREASFGTIYSFTLNANGLGQFHIARKLSLGERDVSPSVTVTITDRDNPQNTISGNVVFGLFGLGDLKLHSQNNTTGAPSDGVTPCTIYVIVNPVVIDIGTLTKLAIRVDGKAFLLGNTGDPAGAFVPLDQDGSATISLASFWPGENKVTVALPESPDGEFFTVRLSFVNFPITQ